MSEDTARQQLHDMLKQLRQWAETRPPENYDDRMEYWRALDEIRGVEARLVPPRNLAGDYPEARPMVGGMDEGDAA